MTRAIRLFGDWDKFDAVMRRAMAQFDAAVEAGLDAAAELAAKETIRGVERQAPGGQKLRPLAPSTLLARRMAGVSGRRALLRTGRIYRSIRVMRAGPRRRLVGVPSEGGMADVARLHEHGAGPFYVRLTPRMIRFLFASGIIGNRAGSGRGSGRGYAVIRIPARPVFGPTARAIARRPGPYIRAARRAFAARLGYAFGR